MTKDTGQPEFSIVIPALNEAKRIGGSLDQLAAYLKDSNLEDSEVVLAIAKSRDETMAIAESKLSLFKNARILDCGVTMGKGYQVKKAMLNARGKSRLFVDADMATPLHHIAEAEAALQDNDVVIAIRNLSTIHTGLRKYISEISNVVARILLRLPFSDTQCGFKGFKGEVADDLFGKQQIMKWVFDMEILAIARKRRYRIAQLPVPDWEDVPDGTFQKVGLRDTMKTLKDILRIRINLWKGAYKK